MQVTGQQLKRVFRYIQYSIDYCLVYKHEQQGLQLHGYSDSDWASSNDRRVPLDIVIRLTKMVALYRGNPSVKLLLPCRQQRLST